MKVSLSLALLAYFFGWLLLFFSIRGLLSLLADLVGNFLRLLFLFFDGGFFNLSGDLLLRGLGFLLNRFISQFCLDQVYAVGLHEQTLSFRKAYVGLLILLIFRLDIEFGQTSQNL